MIVQYLTPEEKAHLRKRILRIWQLYINLERRYGRKYEHVTRGFSDFLLYSWSKRV